MPGTHLLLAAETGCDAGGGSIGLTPILYLIVPKAVSGRCRQAWLFLPRRHLLHDKFLNHFMQQK